jgi:hypothetical protein
MGGTVVIAKTVTQITFSADREDSRTSTPTWATWSA